MVKTSKMDQRQKFSNLIKEEPIASLKNIEQTPTIALGLCKLSKYFLLCKYLIISKDLLKYLLLFHN